ncbi:retropepsin-like aspartic protease family protein [Kordiimonas pumila]|uniref:TIGR02281 family clan AA aspartic protease n=1 Tax=Kordiimonas pumila TaxID=2161677 RepID=A0ABV7D2J8_9PROT|nr:TIGR02281 family clan AA aspartic protease [Kordiimonas pumila]
MAQDPWKVPKTSVEEQRKAIQRLMEEEERRQFHREQPKVLRLAIFLIGMALMLFGLSLAFPLTSSFDPYLVRSLIIVFIFGGAAAFWSRASLVKIIKVAGLWALIIAGISLFYLYRSDLGDRFMASIDPAGVTSTDEGLIVHRSNDGHFWVRARLNGVPLLMMVDTGASNIVLSPEDARKSGFSNGTLSFRESADTAGGKVPFARATATTFVLGDSTYYDVPLTINSAEMSGSLMGMSVLKNFSSVEFRGDTLILRH